MRPIDVLLALFGLGGVALAYKVIQASRASATPEPMLPALVISAGERQAHISARPVIKEAGKKIMGRELTPAELQYVGAIAWLETNYGNGWGKSHPEMVGANNWGAVSCKPGSPDCIAGQQDRFSDGTPYTTGFRRYASPVDGAADVVKHVLVNRPKTAKALAESKPSATRASYAMRRERYYGGVCAKAAAKFGGKAAANSFANPEAGEGEKACAEETITMHAGIAHRNARAIAESLGEPVALSLSQYSDADKWWHS